MWGIDSLIKRNSSVAVGAPIACSICKSCSAPDLKTVLVSSQGLLYPFLNKLEVIPCDFLMGKALGVPSIDREHLFLWIT